MSLLIKGVSAHTGLTDKEVAGVIDHAALSVTDGKIASGVGTADTQLLKLPVAADGLVIKRSGGVWGAGDGGISGVKVRINSQMPILGTRPQLNFIEGAAIDLQLEDNPADDEIDVTVSAKYPTQFITFLPDDVVLPTVNPAALASVDGANFSYECLDFDPATEESVFWEWFLTPDYLSENIVADIYWISAGAGDVKFGFSVLGREKGETWDSALGTEQTVVQTNAGAGLMNKARIATFAPGWSPGDILLFKLARKAADAADTIDANDVRVLKMVVSYTGQFAQAFYPLADSIDITPVTKNSWVDIDVSAYVPTGATGVILHYDNHAGDTIRRAIGLRKKGSTDNRHSDTFGNCHDWGMIGIDENRVFQAYVGSDVTLRLIGYTATGVVFFDNAYDKTPGALAAWINEDCSAECPGAIGIIIEFENYVDGNWWADWGLRKNGSADNYRAGYRPNHSWAVIGCDASQIFQVYATEASQHFFVVGYITEGAVFKTNAVNKTAATGGNWTDVDCSVEAPKSVMLFFDEKGEGNTEGIRKKGSAEEVYYTIQHNFAFVSCNANQKVQYKSTAGADTRLLLIGYATWAGA